ncbi:MAG: hypothetical protein KAV87_12930 [Desulfobacteraceae bacterium]|nr:hypothetical protein [Desulfobacteraceae bacterium]
MTTTKKIVDSKETNWVIANRAKMESEFGVHVNAMSIVDICSNKVQVLTRLAKMTKKELSWMVVSEFDIVNGKAQKYKIGVPGPEFLDKESILFN